MSVVSIEIIALDNEKIYSVGAVKVSQKGDVYVIDKFRDSGDSHLSRHSNGEMHRKFRESYDRIREASPKRDLKSFRGIEFLGTHGFGLKSLPLLFKEYDMKKANGIFAIDMRNYRQGAFNMGVAMLTEEGLPRLYESWKKLSKRQIYIFADCYPMIALMVVDAKSLDKEKG